MLKYYAFRVASFLALLAPVRVGYWMADLSGFLAFKLPSKARAGATINARHVLGPEADEKKVRQVVQGMFLNAAKNYLELFRLPRLDLTRIDDLMRIDGFEEITTALQRGRGLVIATGHCGNFNVVAQFLAARGVPTSVPVEPLEPPPLFEFIRGLRASKGLTFLPLGAGTAVGLVRTLRQGGAVAVAMDRDVTGTGRKVRFFGEETRLPTGYLEMTGRADYDLIVTFCRRLPNNQLYCKVDPPIPLQRTGDRGADLEANLAKVIAIMEDHYRQHPEQWVVFEPLWID